MANPTNNSTRQSKEDKVKAFLAEAQKSYEGEVEIAEQSKYLSYGNVVPSGVINLDIAIGGGIPRGKITQFGGEMGTGKSTLALEVAKQFINMGEYVGYVDTESGLNRSLLDGLRVDKSKLVYSAQVSSGESSLDLIRDMVNSEGFGLIVLDSLAGIVSKDEKDRSMDQASMATGARLINKFLKGITGDLTRTNTALILINQMRTSLNPYGPPRVATGGKGPAYFCSLIVDLDSPASNVLRVGGKSSDAIGKTINAKITKSRFANPLGTLKWDLVFGKGVQKEGSILAVGVEFGFIKLSGAFYKLAENDKVIGQGEEKAKATLRENDELRNSLVQRIWEKWLGDRMREQEELERDLEQVRQQIASAMPSLGVEETHSEENDPIDI